jgi:diguanylate cyclase (GGDEF)-like protein
MENDLFDLFGRYGLAPLFLHTKTLIALIEANGTLLEWNSAFGRLKEAQPDATRIHNFLAETDQEHFTNLLAAAPEKNDCLQARLEIYSGVKRRTYHCLLIVIPDGSFLLIAEPALKTQGEEVDRLARDLRAARHALRIRRSGMIKPAHPQENSPTDPLTFLANQRKILSDLQRRASWSNHARRPLTIFLLDIDHFEQINETYGHLAGDRVLRSLSARLRDSLRQSDAIGHYGGGKFLVLLPGASQDQVIPTAERLLKVARGAEIEIADQVVHATLSLGIAEYRRGENWQDCLERAIAALRESQEKGRDRWSVL